MQLTTDFKKQEFDSKDGASMPDDVLKNVKELAKNLQVLRDFLKKKIIITSGYRSFFQNKKVGGTPNSFHLLGKAADIQVEGLEPLKVKQTIENLIAQGKIKQGGIGLYDDFIHYDTRGKKARWDYRKTTQIKKK